MVTHSYIWPLAFGWSDLVKGGQPYIFLYANYLKACFLFIYIDSVLKSDILFSRIYGDKSPDIIDGLKKNPVVAVPLVLRR